MNTLESFANNFWDFSVAIYAHKGVARWCLGLQDQYQGNVNLALLCWWLGELGIEIGRSGINRLSDRVKQLDDQLLRPYRRIRLNAKQSLDDDIYQKLKQFELELERYQQLKLVEALDKSFKVEFVHLSNVEFARQTIAAHGVGAGSRINLSNYLRRIGVEAAQIDQLIDELAALFA
ncbi:MAG: TIGR02444 family protein [Cellvibrio sp.]